MGVLLGSEPSVGIGVVPDSGDWPLISEGEPTLHKGRDGSGIRLLSHTWVIIHPVQVNIGADPRDEVLVRVV